MSKDVEISKLKLDLKRIIEIIKKDFYDRWYWYYLSDTKSEGFSISEESNKMAKDKVEKRWKKYCKENNIPLI